MSLDHDSVGPSDGGAEFLLRVARSCGLRPTTQEISQLLAYARFLTTEGMEGGGIGPNEGPILLDRHLADSLAYHIGLSAGSSSLLDVGSGVGLPGIPLAIVRPNLSVRLVDRSQRRTDLASRAVRILDLANVAVHQTPIEEIEGTWDVITFRASLRIPAAAEVVRRFAEPTGMGVFGVSRGHEQPEVPSPPEGIRFELTRELTEVLDSPSWLLRMTSI